MYYQDMDNRLNYQDTDYRPMYYQDTDNRLYY